jgi:methionyl aminopeptidase
MAIAIRTEREIEFLRRAGRLVAEILKKVSEQAVAGTTTARLAKISDTMIEQAGATALFRGVTNPQASFAFPASICASINEQLVHGIPCDRILKDGDIISIDCGVKLQGYCGDAATTVIVGAATPDIETLVQVTREMLNVAVERTKPGVYWSQVAGAMQAHAEAAGFSVVRDYVGHGIGRQMHEDPKLPNFVNSELLRNDVLLRKGMILAVEPMVNMGTYKVKVLEDGWTVVTADRRSCAHFEHTLAVMDNGAEILTRLDDEDD